jgi:hypothetical protein
VPAGCPPGLITAPLLPDATEVVSLPGLLNYTTAQPPSAVAEYYQQALPALGWELNGAPTLGDNLALLDFTQTGQQLSIIVTSDAAGTAVQVVLATAP